MLFVYFPALLPLTQVRNRNINKGDRKDADTAEGGPNRINRVPGKDSYLIDAITDVAIGNSRVKTSRTLACSFRCYFCANYIIWSSFPTYMKLIGDVIFAAAGDILTGQVNSQERR
jgi:hypothetical protein